MQNERPFILISNDDGYHAPGIRKLVETLRPHYDLLVCAPESARSGFSCAFSATQPLLLKRRHNMGETEVWSCNGTPVDCVKIALDRLCTTRRPALILGGINHGDNSTVNNHYSGTMGVAKEGCLKGIPSIAFSSCYYEENANLDPVAPYILQIVERVLANGLPDCICLNVNFPALQQFKGVKVCRMTRGDWTQEIVQQQHPRGYDYYWMVGHFENHEPGVEGTDQRALEEGWVAITPTTIDVTAYSFMATAEQQFGSITADTLHDNDKA